MLLKECPVLQLLQTLTHYYDRGLSALRHADGLGPLLLRVYLAPIFIIAGGHKLSAIESTAGYFEYLGLPAPELMAYFAGGTEFIGGWLILVGLGTRLVALPLMMTMVVAAVTAHWQFGWHALPESTLTMPWEWRTDLVEEANVRKDAAKTLLREHGNYDWLTARGSITILKSGIEFAATYFIMLLVLLFTGGGRYVSTDYWLARVLRRVGV